MNRCLLFLFVVVTLLSCSSVWAQSSCRSYEKSKKTGAFENTAINESSGVAASKKNPGIWWTHNDSGGKPRIYAFNEAGKDLGFFDVKGAHNLDWEDMAPGPCPDGKPCLYIGDIGDNPRFRPDITVYRVPEPDLDPTKKNKGTTATAVKFRLKYPDGSHDCEGLWIHPKTRDIVLVTKTRNGKAGIYRMPGSTPPGTETITLQKMGTIKFVGDLVTGADISPHGDQVVIRGYLFAFVYSIGIDGIPKDSTRIGKVDLGPFSQGEAVGYSADGTYLLSTTERLPAPLYRTNCAPDGPEPKPEVAPENVFEPSNEKAKEQNDAGTTDKQSSGDILREETQINPVKGACQCLNAEIGQSEVGFILGILLFLSVMRRRG